MERRIKEADGDRLAFEGLIELLEVALLIGKNLIKSFFSLFNSIGADHLAESSDSVSLEEHMLCTAKADALCAELNSLGCVARSICVGANLKGSVLISPAHDSAELACDGSVDSRDDAVIDVTGGAVDGDEVALMEGLACKGELLVLLVHDDLGAAGDTAGTHTTGNDSCVRCHTAADSQDTLRCLHAGDVLGRGLKADKDNLLASCLPSLSVVSGEDDLAACSAGRSAKTLTDRGSGLECLCVKLGMKEGVEVSGLDHKNSLFLGSHTLVNEIAGDLESCLSGSLTVTGLKHEELAVLDGELHVLHISVMVFKNLADLLELCERLGELLLHLSDLHGSTDTCDDVLALCVGEELTEQTLSAGCGVAGERNAGAAVIAHVAERHGLDVNGSTPRIGDIVVAAINVCAGVVPRTENSLDSAHELLLGIGREIGADLCLVLSLELRSELLEIVSGKLDVLGHALLRLHSVDELLEILLTDLHNDVGIHLNESSVAVPSPTGIAGLLCDSLNDFLVKTEVKNSVHHAGHGSAGAGTDGNEERILLIAELLAGDAFHLDDVLVDLCHDLGIDLAAVLIVLCAGLGGDGEALRNRKTDVCHFSKVRALTAEKLSHLSVALGEQINVLVSHDIPP